jgi:hypothetical protein
MGDRRRRVRRQVRAGPGRQAYLDGAERPMAGLSPTLRPSSSAHWAGSGCLSTRHKVRKGRRPKPSRCRGGPARPFPAPEVVSDPPAQTGGITHPTPFAVEAPHVGRSIQGCPARASRTAPAHLSPTTGLTIAPELPGVWQVPDFGNTEAAILAHGPPWKSYGIRLISATAIAAHGGGRSALLSRSAGSGITCWAGGSLTPVGRPALPWRGGITHRH